MFISKTGNPFVFISSKTIKTKNDNHITFVSVHNPSTFENYELFYDNDAQLPNLIQGDLVDLEIIPSVYQGKVSFKSVLTKFNSKA